MGDLTNLYSILTQTKTNISDVDVGERIFQIWRVRAAFIVAETQGARDLLMISSLIYWLRIIDCYICS